MAGPLFLGGPTTEGKYPPDWLKWEEDGHYSRDVVTITSGSAVTLQAGTVLEGPVGTSIEWAGTNAITSVLFESVTFAAGQTKKVTVIKRMAVADGRYLIATGRTNASILAKIATDLPTILVRTGA